MSAAITDLMANPQSPQPGFALMTNGDDSVFVKLTRDQGGRYDISRVFAALTSNQELWGILQVLKRIGQEVGSA
jgi:hypothetical protein